MCIRKSFLAKHKIKHIGKIYYVILLRSSVILLQNQNKRVPIDISKTTGPIALKFAHNETEVSPYLDARFGPIRPLFLPKNQRFLQGVQKMHV